MIESSNIQKNQGEFYKFDYIPIVSQAIEYLINTSKSQTISFTCKTLKKRVREQSGITLSGCKIRFGLYELLSKYEIKIDRSRQNNRYILDNPISQII